MLEVLEVLVAGLPGEETGASTRTRFVGGSNGSNGSHDPGRSGGSGGSGGCAAAADKRLKGHTAAGTGLRAEAPMRQVVPSRTQREQALSGVTSHLTLERRQLMQASLISFVSPQGNCGGEGLRWGDSVRSSDRGCGLWVGRRMGLRHQGEDRRDRWAAAVVARTQ